jgi:hypothetical protein
LSRHITYAKIFSAPLRSFDNFGIFGGMNLLK